MVGGGWGLRGATPGKDLDDILIAPPPGLHRISGVRVTVNAPLWAVCQFGQGVLCPRQDSAELCRVYTPLLLPPDFPGRTTAESGTSPQVVRLRKPHFYYAML